VSHFGGVGACSVESKHVSRAMFRDSYVTSRPSGFMLSTESGRTLYHPGDTAILGSMKLLAESYCPELGSFAVAGFHGIRVYSNVSAAALVAQWMRLRRVIPTHYAIGSDEIGQLAGMVKWKSPDTEVVMTHPGEWITLPRPVVRAQIDAAE